MLSVCLFHLKTFESVNRFLQKLVWKLCHWSPLQYHVLNNMADAWPFEVKTKVGILSGHEMMVTDPENLQILMRCVGSLCCFIPVAHSLTLKMEAVYSFKTLVNFYRTYMASHPTEQQPSVNFSVKRKIMMWKLCEHFL
jgi:hypothetical protein